MKTIIVAITSALLMAGCRSESGSGQPTGESRGSTETTASGERARTPEPERTVSPLTPAEQVESPADREISQRVRQALLARTELSNDAKTLRVTTRDGVVTLRGPVASEAEKATVARVASSTEGVKRVDTQLELSAQGVTGPSEKQETSKEKEESRPR